MMIVRSIRLDISPAMFSWSVTAMFNLDYNYLFMLSLQL